MTSPLHYLTPGSNSILKLFPSFSSFDLTTHSDKHLPISFEITVIYRHHWIFARDQFFAAPPNWVSLIGSVSQQRSGLTLCEVWFARVCSFHLMYSPDLTPSADSGCDSASLMADIRLSFWPRSERRGFDRIISTQILVSSEDRPCFQIQALIVQNWSPDTFPGIIDSSSQLQCPARLKLGPILEKIHSE